MTYDLNVFAYCIVVEYVLTAFTFGAFCFLLGFRVNRSLLVKVFHLISAMVFFGIVCQWWGYHLVDKLEAGYSYHGSAMSQRTDDSVIGTSIYNSGAKEPLYVIKGYTRYDGISLLVLVPLGYLFAMAITGRRLEEGSSVPVPPQTEKIPPLPSISIGVTGDSTSGEGLSEKSRPKYARPPLPEEY